MVRHDKDHMRRTLQVIAPVFEGIVDHEGFLVVDFLVNLCREHHPRVVGNQMKIVVAGCHLQQDCGNCVVRPVGLDDNGVSGVEVHEDGSSSLKATWHSGLQIKGVSFHVSWFIGMTISNSLL